MCSAKRDNESPATTARLPSCERCAPACRGIRPPAKNIRNNKGRTAGQTSLPESKENNWFGHAEPPVSDSIERHLEPSRVSICQSRRCCSAGFSAGLHGGTEL